jgi:hypothetical protein
MSVCIRKVLRPAISTQRSLQYLFSSKRWDGFLVPCCYRVLLMQPPTHLNSSHLTPVLWRPPNYLSELRKSHSRHQHSAVLVHSVSQNLLSGVNHQIRSRTPRLMSIAQVLDNFQVLNRCTRPWSSYGSPLFQAYILSRVLVTCRRGLDRRIDLLDIHKSQLQFIITLRITVIITYK